ncbi:hypothetical protein NIES37_45200 [Tolypothrix tenuis PCC 7101]|uniref:AAA+ ATPase domain-containing protein n=2 Tax=Tolypothrix TaxID=111782 RepID=A0A1Z4N4C2_9CYAN|nr:hypothetical protein NIES37_45200 [Tolypothrix tenuis PCC 7101]BAZ75553.1 hypothetical protein NIES50_41360 [Aulosira laxa NIES-50]
MPLNGMPLSAIAVESQTEKLSTVAVATAVNILEAIAGKHCLIIGDTGTGKSTIAQWLAQQSNSQVKVYDPDASIDEWQGLEVIGKGGNFADISASMNDDLLEMQKRIVARATDGDKANTGKDLCIIAEEFPVLKDECDIAPMWLGRIARRGRKPKIFVIALSQSDSVTALGIEGDGAIRSNFRYIRLGKFAVNHAKRLKDEGLVQWLQSGKYRCMVDDEPCQLPDLTSYKAVIVRVPEKPVLPSTETPEPLDIHDSPEFLEPEKPVTGGLKSTILPLKDAGYSDTRIIKDVLGYRGADYQKGRQLMTRILNDAT